MGDSCDKSRTAMAVAFFHRACSIIMMISFEDALWIFVMLIMGIVVFDYNEHDVSLVLRHTTASTRGLWTIESFVSSYQDT